MLKMFGSLNRTIAIALKVCIFALIVGIVCVMFAGVIARYFFQAPLFWGDEITIIFLVWMTMLSAPLLVKASENVAISALFELLGARLQNVLAITIDVVLILLFAYLLFLSVELSQKLGFASTPALRISEAVYGWAAIVGFAFMVWFQLQHCFTHMLRLKKSGAGE